MKRLITYCYSLLIILNCSAQSDLIPVKVGKYWGYANEKGELIINPTFLNAYTFANGLACVEARNTVMPGYENVGFEKGLYGYINTKGNFVIKPQLMIASSFEFGAAIVRYVNKPEFSVIDKNGKVLFSESSKMIRINSFFEGGVARVRKMKNQKPLDGDYYINTKGDFVAKPKLPSPYFSMEVDGKVRAGDNIFVDDLAPFYSVPLPKGGEKIKLGLINKNGTIIWQDMYYGIRVFSKNLIFAKTSENLWEALNLEGVKIFPSTYEDVQVYHNKLIFVKGINDLYGAINSSGQEVIKPKFDAVSIDDFDAGIK